MRSQTTPKPLHEHKIYTKYPISNGMDLPCYRTKSMADHYTLETFNTDTVSKSR